MRNKRRRDCNRKKRRALWYKRYGTAERAPCHWCGRPITFDESIRDHEPPISEGGSDLKAVISCWNCDFERSVKTSQRKNYAQITMSLWRKILQVEGGCPL